MDNSSECPEGTNVPNLEGSQLVVRRIVPGDEDQHGKREVQESCFIDCWQAVLPGEA